MFERKSPNGYYGKLAKKYGITKKDAKIIITYFVQKFMKKYMKGNEINIPGVALFSYNKKNYLKYLKSFRNGPRSRDSR